MIYLTFIISLYKGYQISHDFITNGFRKAFGGGAGCYGTFMTFSRFNK